MTLKSKLKLNMTPGQKLGLIVVFLFAVAVIVIAVYIHNETNGYIDRRNKAMNELADQQRMIRSLQTEYDELKTMLDGTTNVKLEETVYSAVELGDKVADAQNELLACHDPDTYVAKLRGLDEFFTSRQKRWINNYPNMPAKWRFATTVSSRSSSFTVIWLCENTETGDILGYTRGNYDAELDKFAVDSAGIYVSKAIHAFAPED